MMKKIKAFMTAFIAVIVIASPTASAAGQDARTLLVGGSVFGVRLYDDCVYVAGLSEVDGEGGKVCPATEAGLLRGDAILRVNGTEAKSSAELSELIDGAHGDPVTLSVRRGDSEFDVTLTPVKSVSDGKYRAGMWVRDSGAGIGTITFVDPGSLAFGALGHGVGVPGENGEVNSGRGAIYDVRISSVVRGQNGVPGELQGSFAGTQAGTLIENTSEGVFGLYSELPPALEDSAELEICPFGEVKAGPAKLYCTLGEDGVGEYDVEISSVSADKNASRSFVVTATDERLIERTGGIVQGMSGSPLVQDGRLIGAVTHVLIADPTRGYGIFIEKMLDCVPEVLR